MASSGKAPEAAPEAEQSLQDEILDSVDWSQARLFNGRLDMRIFRPGSDDFPDMPSCALYAFRFLADLFADPAACGIPTKYHSDVEALERTFWPNIRSNLHKPAVLISFDEDPATKGTRIRPVSVRVGTSDKLMEIADSPNALGYIFTIANPVSDATPRGYLYPLAATYSLFVYLVTTWVHAKGTIVHERSPLMACLMYYPPGWDDEGKEVKKIPYLLGHTFKSCPQYNKPRGAFRAFDIWREKQLLQCKPSYASLSRQDHPEFRERLVLRFLLYLSGEAPPRASRKPDWCKDFFAEWTSESSDKGVTYKGVTAVAEWQRARVAQFHSGPAGDWVYPINSILSSKMDDFTISRLFSSLEQLVKPGQDDMLKWRPVMELILTPLIQPSGQAPHSLAPSAADKELWEKELKPLVDYCLDEGRLGELKTRLKKAWEHVSYPAKDIHELGASRPFGRCAELYPMIALTPESFPKLDPAQMNMPYIQGLAIRTKSLGEAITAGCFNSHFTLRKFGEVRAVNRNGTREPMCRDRCDICVLATGRYQCRDDGQKRDMYDEHAKLARLI